MATYIPPKKSTEFIMYVSLKSQADGNIFQSDPTIAAGDFKVSTDGGALGNLSTLPAVTPASSKMVKITLSTTEMNGDNVTVVGSDASGAEWCDVMINIQTSTNQIDDLSMLDAAGIRTAVGLASANLDTQLDALPTAAENAAQVRTELTTELGRIDAAVTTRASQTSLDTLDDYVDTEVAGIKTKTDQLTFTDTGKVDATLQAAADLDAAVANKIADHTLRRTYANARASSDGDAVSFRSLLGAIAKLVNKWSISGTTLTVTHEDDSTTAGTQTLTATAGAEPITTIDTD